MVKPRSGRGTLFGSYLISRRPRSRSPAAGTGVRRRPAISCGAHSLPISLERRAEGSAAEGELVDPQAVDALVPILRGRLPVRATADGTGGHVPDRSVGATGSTGDRGVVVALDVTRARRTGRGLVHGGAIADGVTLDGGVEVPAIGDARRFGGEAAGKAGPLFLRRRRSGGAQGRRGEGGRRGKEGGGRCSQGAGEDGEAQSCDHVDTSFSSGARVAPGSSIAMSWFPKLQLPHGLESYAKS